MPTLRHLIDQTKEVFDATVAAVGHGGFYERQRPEKKYGRSRIEAASRQIELANRVQAIAINQYVYEVAASGQRLQEEYQRGYQEGYKDGVQAATPKPTPKQAVPVLQSHREVEE